MRYILTPKEMIEADKQAIEEFGIPSAILMENAARSASEFIDNIAKNSHLKSNRVLIICGSGNNGGDGFALARHLYNLNYNVKVYKFGNIDKMSEETKTNLMIIKNLGLSIENMDTMTDVEKLQNNYDVIIDSMIGIGGSENLRGILPTILRRINTFDGIKIAIDVPTGMNAKNGYTSPDCFKADHTITMFAEKAGFHRNAGMKYPGKIHIAYLGINQEIVEKKAKIRAYNQNEIKTILKQRERVSSKFDYGRALIIAGSKNMPGAAALTANAAISSGAGLVELCSPEIHSAVKPEVLSTRITFEDKDGLLDTLNKSLKKANSIAIGPGLGDKPEVIDFLKDWINLIPVDIPIVIDADGLKAIDKDSKLRQNIILTPHTGEFSNLIETHRKQIEPLSHEYAIEWAEKLNCIIHLKHIPSVTTNGKHSYWTLNGNPGMATAGSGDVLTGIIVALLAQGLEPMQATSLASYIHASAGDFYAREYPQHTMTAGDIIDKLKYVFDN